MMCEPTPCVIPKVSREAEFTVTIEKEGYKTATYNVTHEMAGGGGAGNEFVRPRAEAKLNCIAARLAPECLLM